MASENFSSWLIEQTQNIAQNKTRIMRWGVSVWFILSGLVFLIPKTYDARCSLIPVESKSMLMSDLMDNAIMSGMLGMPGAQNNADVLMSILGSTTLREKLLNDDKILIGLLGERRGGEAARERDLNKENWLRKNFRSLRQQINNKVTIHHSVKGIIEIKASADNPDFAAYLANQFPAALAEIIKSKSLTNGKRKRAFIEEMLDARKHDLRRVQQRLFAFEPVGNTLNLPANLIPYFESLSDLMRRKAALDLSLSFLKGFKSSNSTEQIGKLQKQIDQIEEQEKEIQSKIDLSQSGRQQDMRPVGKLPAVALEFQQIQLAAKSLEEVLVILTKELEMARIDESKDDLSFEILDRAIPNAEHASPARASAVVILFFVSFFIVTVLVIKRKFFLKIFDILRRA